MKAAQLIVFCTVLSGVCGHQRFFWVDHGGVCRNSYGYLYSCIHYNNCYPNHYHRYTRGQTKICGVYYGALIMCCSDDTDDDYADDLLPPSEYDYDSISYIFHDRKFKVTTEKPSTTRIPSLSKNNNVMVDKKIFSYKYGQENLSMDDNKNEFVEKENNTLRESSPPAISSEVNSSSRQNDPIAPKNITEVKLDSMEIDPSRMLYTSPVQITTQSTIEIEQINSFVDRHGSNTPIEETTTAQSEDILTETAVQTENIETDLIRNRSDPITSVEEISTADPIDATTVFDQIDLPNSQNEPGVMPLVNVAVTQTPKKEEPNFSVRTTGIEQQEIEMASQNVTINFPYYPPLPENSTSLRECRNLYQDATREDAWNYRMMNKAELGYGNESSIEWSCTGSLISERYILTAAHCEFSDKMEPAKYARLGNFRTANPLNQQRLQNFTIDIFISHPLYNLSLARSQHDIALIRLNASAIYSEFVRPACLATKFDLASIPLWLLSVVPITFIHITTNRCRKLYNDTDNSISDILQGCAVTDSYFFCQYDSGAPFMFINADYDFGNFPEIAGIASYGDPCSDKPAVSTRVLPYVPWIERIVWPNEEVEVVSK